MLSVKKRGEGAARRAPDSMRAFVKTEKDDPLRFASAVGFGARGQGQNQGYILVGKVIFGDNELEGILPLRKKKI